MSGDTPNDDADNPTTPADPTWQCGGGGGDGWWDQIKDLSKAAVIAIGRLFGDNPAEPSYQNSPSDEVVLAAITKREQEEY